jgi:hypothetical protein
MRILPFFKRTSPRLEDFFDPLAEIAFPDELLFLGSGSTPPKPEWAGISSVRVNDKTLDLYPEHPVFGVISQILSTPKVLRHPLFRGERTPWLWQFMNEIKLETGRKREREGEGERGKPLEKYRLIGTKDLKDTAFYRGLDSQFTTGSLVVLFLLYAPVKHFLIAGYDGYKGRDRYLRADGKPWHGRHHGHDLGAEWALIEKAAARAREAGKTVEIAMD